MVDENIEQENKDTDFDRKLNAAITGHMKRFKNEFSTEMSSLKEMLGSHKTPAPQTQDISETEVLKKELEKIQKEREQERGEMWQKETFATVRAALGDKVRPEAVDTVLKLFKNDYLEFKGQGRNRKVAFKMGDESFDSIEDGLSAWLESKEAAFFRPAPSYSAPKQAQKQTTKLPVRTGQTQNEGSPEERILRKLQASGQKL